MRPVYCCECGAMRYHDSVCGNSACPTTPRAQRCDNDLGEEGAATRVTCTRPEGHAGYCSHDGDDEQ